MIKKIVHYIWVGEKPMNDKIKGFINNWKKVLGSEWEFKLWDNNSVNFNSHPFLKYHSERKNWAFISDFLRIYAIYKYGGFYLDTDVELIKPLDKFTKYKGVFSFIVSLNLTASTIGGEAGDKIFKDYLEIYKNEAIIKTQPEATSAAILAYVVRKKYPWKLTGDTQIMDNYLFLDEKILQVPIDEENIAIHHHHNNWKGDFKNPGDSKFFKYKIENYKKPETIKKMKEYLKNKIAFIDECLTKFK